MRFKLSIILDKIYNLRQISTSVLKETASAATESATISKEAFNASVIKVSNSPLREILASILTNANDIQQYVTTDHALIL